ncbi:MAG: hypothetical protein H0V17_21475 [Deltaproteobacteria bacterium]|nr:hypothetical protein [Deltaproteobacteria bacterium]
MKRLGLPAVLALVACGSEVPVDNGRNPFLEDLSDSGKEDSGYLNPDGVEVEVDLEGDVTGGATQIKEGPAMIGQFAMTFFRKQEKLYIESLAEDASSATRAEWLIDGVWLAADKVPAGASRKRWRLRGLNAVHLFAAGTKPKVGDELIAKVPVNPFTVFRDAGDSCADSDDHIPLDQAVYWYRWEGDRPGCKAALQDLKITVSKTFSTATAAVYPEYDQLVADNKVTVAILFGQIGDEATISSSDPGVRNHARYGRMLTDAGFKSVTAPVGKRFEKTLRGGVVAQIDLYAPKDFSGLGDFEHFDNFQKALSEHEVVAYDGHSMLGASDFWTRPEYPSFYQIYLYGGCLGYEYYIKPILHGKGDSWAKLDIMSSVIEVTADATDFAAPAIAKLLFAIENGKRSSWKQVLNIVRENVGDSTFGVSGVRDNCYAPGGNRC